LADDLAIPENAEVTVFGGALELPVRAPVATDALLRSLPEPEAAVPEPMTEVRPGVVRIESLGLEVGAESDFKSHIDEDDPLSAVVEMRQSQTVSRGEWRIRIETSMQMSCTHAAFLLRATMRAYEADEEVCHREWDHSVPRRFV
jgi:hypothetical protein